MQRVCVASSLQGDREGMPTCEIGDPQISVIVPTRNRAQVLIGALKSFVVQDTAANWEIILVDNGSIDDTADVAAAFTSQLPLKVLFEGVPGKSRALNRALEIARGRLIAFTDDDVHVSRSWISELLRAATVYPEASVFCGPIIPVLPHQTPHWLRDHRFASAAFASFAPPIGEGVLMPPSIPFGPNFALRADQCVGMQFRLDLGPSINGTFMCEDTEFVGHFRRRGAQFIYLPVASVQHQIREELISLPSQYERSFYLGRSLLIAGKPIVTLRTFAFSSIPEIAQFEQNMILNFYLGQLCQLTIFDNPTRSQILLKAIEQIGWDGDPTSLGKSADEWLRTHPLKAGTSSPEIVICAPSRGTSPSEDQRSNRRAPDESRRGVYFLANDSVIDTSIAFLSSFRTYNPSIPLCLVPFDRSVANLSQLQERFNFSIWQDDNLFRRCDDISLRFHDSVHGHYRKLAMWSGPYEEFIYVDTDTIVLESVEFVFKFLSAFGFVTSHSNIRKIRKWVWKDSIAETRQLSAAQIAYATNTGFISSKKGNLSIDEAVSKLPGALDLAPHMELLCIEQPFLNYLIVTSGLRYTSLYSIFLKNRSPEIALEQWGGNDIGPVIHGRVVQPGFPRTLLVHWAGEWERARSEGQPIRNLQLWEFYRYK
jgi:glycosyltransferase involved in cell wall biosynthesis